LPFAAEGENLVMTRDQLVNRLKKAGELIVSGEDQVATDSHFDTRSFRFHGPDGFETDYAGLAGYFRAICQTWIEGRFVREFTHSPAGPVPPNGQRIVWDLFNIFRFDDQGRIVEEWVRTDYRSLLRQLGAEGK
jgi:predicted ester cyclase